MESTLDWYCMTLEKNFDRSSLWGRSMLKFGKGEKSIVSKITFPSQKSLDSLRIFP